VLAHGGVVDQTVDAAELLQGGGDDPFRAVRLGQVGRNGDGPAAGLADRAGGLLEQFRAPADQGHGRAGGAEQPRGGRPDPAARAGHHHRRPGQGKVDDAAGTGRRGSGHEAIPQERAY
jgi:hypothetical protein